MRLKVVPLESTAAASRSQRPARDASTPRSTLAGRKGGEIGAVVVAAARERYRRIKGDQHTSCVFDGCTGLYDCLIILEPSALSFQTFECLFYEHQPTISTNNAPSVQPIIDAPKVVFDHLLQTRWRALEVSQHSPAQRGQPQLRVVPS